MKKADYIALSILAAGAIFGRYLHNYIGGIITGACCCALLLATIGKRQAAKAAARIDKLIVDQKKFNDARNSNP